MFNENDNSGVKTSEGIPVEASKLEQLKGSHEMKAEDVQLEFEEVVGRAMEKISDEEKSSGIEQIQEEVTGLLKKLQEKINFDDDSLRLLEEAILDVKMEAFNCNMALSVGYTLYKEQEEENKKLLEAISFGKEELKRQMYDSLTGVYLKEYFMSGFRSTLSTLQREAFTSSVPISVLFFDIDHFKHVNDEYGHLAGDDVLAKIGKIVSEGFQRQSDTVGRFGGEEFGVVMPKCNLHNAMRLAENLRKKVEEATFTTLVGKEEVEFGVTISIGALTVMLHKSSNDDLDDTMRSILEQVDALMYQGKNSGRNKVIAEEINIGEMSDVDGVLV